MCFFHLVDSKPRGRAYLLHTDLQVSNLPPQIKQLYNHYIYIYLYNYIFVSTQCFFCKDCLICLSKRLPIVAQRQRNGWLLSRPPRCHTADFRPGTTSIHGEAQPSPLQLRRRCPAVHLSCRSHMNGEDRTISLWPQRNSKFQMSRTLTPCRMCPLHHTRLLYEPCNLKRKEKKHFFRGSARLHWSA